MVRDYIREIKDQTTIILTTHDMEEAGKLSDRICIIDKGRVLAVGKPEEIIRSRGPEELIEIETDGDAENEIAPCLGNNGWELKILSKSLAAIKSDNPREAFNRLTKLAAENKIKINGINLRKKSLEDLFIEMTGRKLRE